MESVKYTARVSSVQDDLVTIETLMTDAGPAPIMKNEVIYICPTRKEDGRQERLKAEVLRINGNMADAQVFENTIGVAVGDPVEQSQEMLSVSLGPGLLGQVYDGGFVGTGGVVYFQFVVGGQRVNDCNREVSGIPFLAVGA